MAQIDGRRAACATRPTTQDCTDDYEAAGRFALTAGVNLNGRFRTAFCTAPLRMHCTHTRAVFVVPLAVVIFTRWRLGLNCRRVMPVILVPTPPRYFALPRNSTELPIWERLPQTSHTRAIGFLSVLQNEAL